MKVQYTFTADYEDVQEILYQKYNRIYGRNNLGELHSEVKAALINKKSLKHIEKLLTNYRDALVSVLEEVEENRGFMNSLMSSLNGATNQEEPEIEEETEKIVQGVKETEHSIEQLSNIIESLSSVGNNHE
tara:strand:- start:840 stop:1232 length:393 start_codon:yes stop_codon:yes gene_type:complete